MSYAKRYLGTLGPCGDRYNCFRFRGGPCVPCEHH